MAEDFSIFRVTGQQHSMDITPSQVGAQVEFTRISRRADPLNHSENFDLVAKCQIAAPPDEDSRVGRLLLAIQFDRAQSEQKGRESTWANLRLRCDRACGGDETRPLAQT